MIDLDENKKGITEFINNSISRFSNRIWATYFDRYLLLSVVWMDNNKLQYKNHTNGN